MSIYLCGACNTGKAEIARKLGVAFPDLEVVLDPAEAVFFPIFGVGLGRFFRGRLWESKPDETLGGIMDYLNILDRENIICNEGPLLFLTHVLFFGVMGAFEDKPRKEILLRCYSQLRKGYHFVIRRWADSGNFCQASVQLQRDIGVGRKNIYIVPPAVDYESTVELGYEFILGKMEVVDNGALADSEL